MIKKRTSLVIIGVVAILIAIGATAYIGITLDRSQPISKGDCVLHEGKEHCTGDYVGMAESDALAKAKAEGLPSRVISDNKNPNISITDDRVVFRINFTIVDNKVTKAEFF